VKDELIKRLKDVGALKFGEFTLSSGKKSSVYVDIKLASTFPDILDLMAKGVAALAKEFDFDKIACVELGGVPVAVATALEMKKPYVIFRKERKDYGLGGDRIGSINEGERFVIIEDVVTTGRSALSAAKRVEEAGGRVEGIIAVVDREEGDVNVKSLLKLAELLEADDSRETSKL
jgi:orotate phosphoribosyltransferase